MQIKGKVQTLQGKVCVRLQKTRAKESRQSKNPCLQLIRRLHQKTQLLLFPSKLPGTNLPSSNTTCLLKTAITEIRSGPIHCKAQILFDEDAQRFFMTQQLADSLKVETRTREYIYICIWRKSRTKRITVSFHCKDDVEVPISVL